MTILPEEAARTLKEAEAAADRSTTAVGYQRSSQHLILWGLVWAVGNIAAFFRLPLGSLAFLALMLIGVAGSFVIGLRASRRGQRDYALRSLVVAAAFLLFSFGVQVVAQITSFAVAEAVICLAIGVAYMVMGLSLGWRMIAVGAGLMIAIIAGWIYARDHFFLWMAFAGGGGLVLGGLWLRKA